ncbi:MAG: IS1634 family transposase [Elusimicrobiota bacterium]
MFIRKTTTRTNLSGQKYTTFRLVSSVRENGKVRQKTVLNLGENFTLGEEDWPALVERIESLLKKQFTIEFVPANQEIEVLARYYYEQIQNKQGKTESAIDNSINTEEEDYQEVDVNSLEMTNPKTIGVEYVGLETLNEIGLPEILAEEGFNSMQIASVMAAVIGRMAEPGSELSTLKWLKNKSALGELLDIDFEKFSIMNLYRASDLLVKNRESIENKLFNRINGMLWLPTTVTLYDLTNTYFEGDMDESEKAKRGHSKEKRTDCPIVTLALVLDGSGFVRRSKVFEGNIFEGNTFVGMISELGISKSSIIVMDRGIATEENIAWMKSNDYKYIVVSRERYREFEEDNYYTEIETSSREKVKLQRASEEDCTEFHLYCHSELRQKKESAIVSQACERYEKELNGLNDGLCRPKTTKSLEKVLERLGRLKQKYQIVSRHYNVEIEKDKSGTKVISIKWIKNPQPNSQMTHPGVYCLRSNVDNMSDADLWKTYIMLTNLESVFRSLKSELGLRPVFHRNDGRVEGHLFITVLAYQTVQMIRYRLNLSNINISWAGLRTILGRQMRITSCFKLRTGGTLHIRKSTVPDPELIELYDALKLAAKPGITRKFLY